MATLGVVSIAIVGVIVIVAAGLVLSVVQKVKSTLDPFIEIANSVDIEAQDLEIETSPKSVNAMTSVYLPRIEADFPEFNYFEFKAKAENMMKSALNAITTDDISKLINASSDLTAQINNILAANRANHVTETFRDIEIHRTEIKNYRKTAGNCIITLQTAVGCYHFVTRSNGEIVKGSEDRKYQTRYDIDLMYIQDASQVSTGDSFVSNNCPNCGAPIKALGVKNCPYCGSGVEGINIRSWTINKLTEC